MKKVKVTITAMFLLICSVLNIVAKPQKMIYIEQVYRLYESNLLSNQTNYKRNIFWLENSLKLVNAHPSQAIIVTNTWEEYVKYKLLLRFHIYYLLTKEYVGWGWEFDKRDVVFYNAEWAEEIKNSFEIAKSRYDIAKHYWEKTKLYAQEINKINVRIGWEQIEDLAYEIDNQQFDYDYDDIIEMRLNSIENKLAKLDTFLIH
ncbi:MAG: hypothetical protein J1G30_08835 [Spirochaetales bacterium]|nr:hypothetical protein [Spirochaetales bacterium]